MPYRDRLNVTMVGHHPSCLCMAFSLLSVFALATRADAGLIANGNFAGVSPALEKNGICTTDRAIYPSVDPGYYPACSASGWTGTYQIGNGATVGYSGVSFGIPQPDPGGGGNALILQAEHNVAPTATQSIVIPATGSYTLTFYIANRSTPAVDDGPQTVSVLLDNTVIAGGTYAKLPAAWTLETLTFTASAGSHSLTFEGLDETSGKTSANVAAFVDDISLLPASSGQPPVIGAGGVVSASAFGEFTSISPGSWIEIYGSNLAVDTRSWTGTDFNGVNAPTSLDGTSVTIGGQAAFVDFISPGQVNALVPSNVASGSQPLTVTVDNVTSAAYSINVNPVEPGLDAPPSFNIGGIQYVVALYADGTYVLPEGAIAGVNSRPAQPGDEIVLYGIGFGPVTPNLLAGQLVQQTNALASTFDISVGGVPAGNVLYSGLAPNYTGLYQFNIVVPANTGSGAVPLTFTVDGAAGTQTLYLAVGN
jgi:uncharacterized protein (TIGR03437 family)